MDIKRLETLFHNLGIYVDEEDYKEELGLDSLQFVSLIVAIEQEFLIRISDITLEDQQLLNFQDYIDMVNKHFV